MDGKGRVALPSAYRAKAKGDRFVLVQWEDTHLTLFPESTWVEKQPDLLEFRRSGDEAAQYVRDLLSMAVGVRPDKQGRILVPRWLQEAAGLGGPTVINGNIDRIELWNPTAFKKRKSKSVSQDVSGFAKRILG